MSYSARLRTEGKRPILLRYAQPMLCVLVLFYLGYHTVSGDRSLFALFKEKRKLEALSQELADTIAKRETLEKRVAMLSSNSLDLDLLDEQARTILGMAGKGEVVIFLDGK
ncbi:MAG: septum formation initiator family protein [Rickettsiales bacterium]|jgi:cell division protein FtsB|nr:septum formation initiator family protein [Rickettsiales bacterium]